MNILALETSGLTGSIALLQGMNDDLEVLAQEPLPENSRSAQSLLPAVEQLLKRLRLTTADLGCLAVARGPGSFTGLRVGIATAKTLAYATGARLVGVPTLAALAAGAFEHAEVLRATQAADSVLWSILDAQRQQLFAARFGLAEGNSAEDLIRQAKQQTAIVDRTTWKKQLQTGDLVCGPPCLDNENFLPSQSKVLPPECHRVSAAVVGRLAYAELLQGRCDDVFQLVPDYHRMSAAEEKAATQ